MGRAVAPGPDQVAAVSTRTFASIAVPVALGARLAPIDPDLAERPFRIDRLTQIDQQLAELQWVNVAFGRGRQGGSAKASRAMWYRFC
jgi:hypothetical protein